MDQPSLEAVVERLERVERENRRWKVVSLLTVMTMASIIIMGQTWTRTTVEAENFVVKDRRGVAIGFFGATYPPDSDTGSGMLGFYTYRPDGKHAIGTFLTEGNGEAELSLNSSLANGAIRLRTGYNGSDASIEVMGPVAPSGRPTVWVAP